VVKIQAQDLPTAPENVAECATPDPLYHWQMVDGKCQKVWSFTVQIDINYPPQLDSYPAIKSVVLDYLKEEETDFIQLAAGAIRDPMNPYSLTIDYQVFNYTPTIQTFVFEEKHRTGGAHENVRMKTLTFDVLTNRQITLDTVFQNTPNALRQIAFLIRKARFESNPFGLLDEWFFRGTEATLDNYHAFVMLPDALAFYFVPYQVSPFATGVQTASVPWHELRAYVWQEFWR
jgi:hypothetical protein